MSRLTSLNASRPRRSDQHSPTGVEPPVPSAEETTSHRKLRLVIEEFRSTVRSWDELVGFDGLQAAKTCVDEITEMK